jgi:hypothetical protein
MGSVCDKCRPSDTPQWAPVTQRLIRQGVLIDSGGQLTMPGESETLDVNRARQARADLDRWRDLTALILEEQHLEQAIREELDDEEC